ncbi:beta-catenin-interacting protein 1 isoform X1 [Kogia breviceps]|uniref:beta-catenin-interacting protein 1 isoform X1 n=1 Tax=Kogia breviceps TaxID=27615 RepID=UPI0034D25363
MNREGAPGKSPEEMYIQQKVRVLLMLRKMGSNLTASEEEFLRTYAGVVNSQLSQLPQHSIDQDGDTEIGEVENLTQGHRGRNRYNWQKYEKAHCLALWKSKRL